MNDISFVYGVMKICPCCYEDVVLFRYLLIKIKVTKMTPKIIDPLQFSAVWVNYLFRKFLIVE
jgi:hypothetical protein